MRSHAPSQIDPHGAAANRSMLSSKLGTSSSPCSSLVACLHSHEGVHNGRGIASSNMRFIASDALKRESVLAHGGEDEGPAASMAQRERVRITAVQKRTLNP